MVEAGQIAEKLAELMDHLSGHFARWEPLAQAGEHVRGLLSDLPRKNCWTLAEYARDSTPDRMQRLLERASWDTSRRWARSVTSSPSTSAVVADMLGYHHETTTKLATDVGGLGATTPPGDNSRSLHCPGSRDRENRRLE